MTTEPTIIPTDVQERISLLTEAFAGLSDEIEQRDAQRQAIRTELSEIVSHYGPLRVQGFGGLEITAPAVIVTYDRAKLDALIDALLGLGEDSMAAAIQEARKESLRTGSLRITRDR